jgi:hypothetical protein
MSIFYNKHFNAALREASLEKGLKIALQENILFCMKAITSNFFSTHNADVKQIAVEIW